jgi:PEGA domain
MDPRSLLMNWRAATVLQVFVLGASLAGHAVVKSGLRITVLDEETHLITVNDTGVPKNCDGVNYDAYCHNSRTTIMTNTLLVEEENGESYRVMCTVETRWSHCKPLLKGFNFDARKEKHGLLIYYLDEAGKLRKQLYTYVDEDKAAPASTKAPSPVKQEPQVPAQEQPPASSTKTEPQPSVKCSFTSTPSGADIAVDGKYVGSTPSEVMVSSGSHVVVISMPGFLQWKRDLTVSKGSELTVNAVLEKVQ